MAIYALLLVLVVAVSATASAIQLYNLQHKITGPEFYVYFDFQHITDPTHGRV